MPNDFATISDAALKMPEEQQRELAALLEEQLLRGESHYARSWRTEIDRRKNLVAEGKASFVSLDQLKGDLRNSGQ